jgi:hypothetical protein
LQQDATGSKTMTWPLGTLWLPADAAPTLQTGANKVDVIVFQMVGSTWYGRHDGYTTASSGGDANAQNYIDRLATAGYTVSSAESDAIIAYVQGLKSNGLWDKIYDQGLLIGGTAAAHAVTLKGVAPSTTWVNSPTHSSGGVLGNGTSSYGNLGITPSTSLSQNSIHIAVYSRSDVNSTSPAKADIGCSITGSVLYVDPRNNNTARYVLNDATAGTPANSSSLGFFVATRTASNARAVYKGGSSLGSDAITSVSLPTSSMYLLASNAGGTASSFSNRQISLWSVGSGLTASEVATFNTLVETLQDALGRGVQ